MSIAKRTGLVLEVCFEIDESGLLTVTAKDPVTNKSANIAITSDKLNLTNREIKDMAKLARKQQDFYAKQEVKALKQEQRAAAATENKQAQGSKKDKGCAIF